MDLRTGSKYLRRAASHITDLVAGFIGGVDVTAASDSNISTSRVA